MLRTRPKLSKNSGVASGKGLPPSEPIAMRETPCVLPQIAASVMSRMLRPGGEDSYGHHIWIVERVEEGIEELDLDLFPRETASHINRIHFGAGRQFRD